jgi:hypothetical protein
MSVGGHTVFCSGCREKHKTKKRPMGSALAGHFFEIDRADQFESDTLLIRE